MSLKAHTAKHVKAIPVGLRKHFCLSAVLHVSIVAVSKVLGYMLARDVRYCHVSFVL